MISFKSPDDLSKLPPDNPAYAVIEGLVKKLLVTTELMPRPYDPEADGWIVLIEESDIDRPLTEIWGDDAYSLIDVPWEGITRDESGEPEAQKRHRESSNFIKPRSISIPCLLPPILALRAKR